MRFATCHTDSLYYALGLCRSCYYKRLRKTNPRDKAKQAVYQRRYESDPKRKTWRVAYRKAYYKQNRKRLNAYAVVWLRAHPKRAKLHRTKSVLRRFGITLEQYDALLKKQRGVCKICKKVSSKGRRLAVDHNHKTGRVRGLLCSRCNLMLGFLEESPQNLRRAPVYLGY